MKASTIAWSDAPVSPDLIGLWGRRLLVEPDGTRDTETIVWWLQTEHLFVDIRVPADRPDFSGITGFDACDETMLAYLARQEGFAGHLEHRPGALAWRRAIDYRPLGGPPDEGYMRWDGPDSFTETGMHVPYLEEWVQWMVDDARNQTVQHWPAPSEPLFVRAGPIFMRAQDHRPQPVPPGLSEAVRRPMELLNCEISFGRVDPNGVARIELSTLPWLEGSEL